MEHSCILCQGLTGSGGSSSRWWGGKGGAVESTPADVSRHVRGAAGR